MRAASMWAAVPVRRRAGAATQHGALRIHGRSGVRTFAGLSSMGAPDRPGARAAPASTAAPTDLNRWSATITQPKSQGASQAMLYATGMTKGDMSKPQIGACAGRAMGGGSRGDDGGWGWTWVRYILPRSAGRHRP